MVRPGVERLVMGKCKTEFRAGGYAVQPPFVTPFRLRLNWTTPALDRLTTAGESWSHFAGRRGGLYTPISISSLVRQDRDFLKAFDKMSKPTIVLLGLTLILGANAVLRICQEDTDCQRDECCTLNFVGQDKICKEIPDDYGDFCGGTYFCGHCRDGLECVPVTQTTDSLCGHPANGTCKYQIGNRREPTAAKIFPKFTPDGRRSCHSDRDCRVSECCATHFTGNGKICRDIGDDVGDSCGGEYFCSSCDDNLLCLPNPRPEHDDPKDTCSRPSHGSCQYPTAKKNLVPATENETLPLMVTGYQRPCLKDLDCGFKECCVTHFSGLQKVCRDLGDDLGDSCGGEYFCNACDDGLECVSEPAKHKVEKSKCARPANGTCQYPANIRLILDEDD